MKTIWRKPNASKKLRKKAGGSIKVWMLRKICESEPRLGVCIISGWMEGAINIMAWTPSEASRMAVDCAFAAKTYRGILTRHQNHLYDLEQKRINKMFQEVGL